MRKRHPISLVSIVRCALAGSLGKLPAKSPPEVIPSLEHIALGTFVTEPGHDQE
jgi:hypothetical protein